MEIKRLRFSKAVWKTSTESKNVRNVRYMMIVCIIEVQQIRLCDLQVE